MRGVVCCGRAHANSFRRSCSHRLALLRTRARTGRSRAEPRGHGDPAAPCQALVRGRECRHSAAAYVCVIGATMYRLGPTDTPPLPNSLPTFQGMGPWSLWRPGREWDICVIPPSYLAWFGPVACSQSPTHTCQRRLSCSASVVHNRGCTDHTRVAARDVSGI